jgi:hypothetical protein
MKKLIVALALAGAIGLSGCANLPIIGGLDPAVVLADVRAALDKNCPILNGAIPTLQSIQALIAANDPKLIVVNNALITGENLALAICRAATAASPAARSGAMASSAVHAPIFVGSSLTPVFFQ